MTQNIPRSKGIICHWVLMILSGICMCLYNCPERVNLHVFPNNDVKFEVLLKCTDLTRIRLICFSGSLKFYVVTETGKEHSNLIYSASFLSSAILSFFSSVFPFHFLSSFVLSICFLYFLTYLYQ